MVVDLSSTSKFLQSLTDLGYPSLTKNSNTYTYPSRLSLPLTRGHVSHYSSLVKEHQIIRQILTGYVYVNVYAVYISIKTSIP